MSEIKNIIKYIDFKFEKLNYIVIPVFLLCYLYIKIFHIPKIEENSFVEYLQLFPLIISFALCLKAKDNKRFFNFVAFIVFLLFMRELSFGRTIFCTIPYMDGGVYQWSHYKYGFLADYIVASVVIVAFIIAFIKKVHLDFLNVIKNACFPFWTFILMIIALIFNLIGEANHNSGMEETAELIIYCLLTIFIFIYRKK